MLKNYFKKKSKLSIGIDILIGLMLILLLIPATRKDMAAFILKPTLFIHQPKVLSEKVKLSEEAFNWELKTIDGEEVRFSDFQEKVVFINLWATWCPPCIAEMPDMQRLYNDYSDKIDFLFISNEDSKPVNQFLNKKGYTFPVYTPLSSYPANFEANSLPTTFIISKKGEIVVHRVGVAQWNSGRMRTILDALINQ